MVISFYLHLSLQLSHLVLNFNFHKQNPVIPIEIHTIGNESERFRNDFKLVTWLTDRKLPGLKVSRNYAKLFRTVHFNAEMPKFTFNHLK